MENMVLQNLLSDPKKKLLCCGTPAKEIKMSKAELIKDLANFIAIETNGKDTSAEAIASLVIGLGYRKSPLVELDAKGIIEEYKAAFFCTCDTDNPVKKPCVVPSSEELNNFIVDYLESKKKTHNTSLLADELHTFLIERKQP